MTGVRLEKDRACTGKARHTTRPRAMVALRILRQQGGGAHVVPYACPHCPYYHLGHLPYDARDGAP